MAEKTFARRICADVRAGRLAFPSRELLSALPVNLCRSKAEGAGRRVVLKSRPLMFRNNTDPFIRIFPICSFEYFPIRLAHRSILEYTLKKASFAAASSAHITGGIP